MRFQPTLAIQSLARAKPLTRYTAQATAIGGLLIAPLLWAGNFIVGRMLRDDVPPVTLNFWRWALALLILLPLCSGQLRRHHALLRREWKLIAACGATGIAGFQIMVYQALTTTTAINATLITATAPLAIVLGSWLVLRKSVTRTQLLGLLGALAGAVVVITQGRLGALLALQPNPGDLLMLAAIVVWSAYSLLLARCPRELPALALLTATVAAAVLVMLPFYLWRLVAGEQLVLSAPNLLGIAYSGICSSVLAFFAWTRGVARLGATRAGMFINLMPIYAALLSLLLLGEPVAAYHGVGAALVFGGLLLANWRPAQPPAEPN